MKEGRGERGVQGAPSFYLHCAGMGLEESLQSSQQPQGPQGASGSPQVERTLGYFLMMLFFLR